MGDSLSRLDNLLAIFIHNSIYFFFYWLINCFAQSLAPTYLLYLKNYLVLLSSISFLAILSKHYLLLYQYIIVNRIKFNFINLLIKLVVVFVVALYRLPWINAPNPCNSITDSHLCESFQVILSILSLSFFI